MNNYSNLLQASIVENAVALGANQLAAQNI